MFRGVARHFTGLARVKLTLVTWWTVRVQHANILPTMTRMCRRLVRFGLIYDDTVRLIASAGTSWLHQVKVTNRPCRSQSRSAGGST
jgi:hypothetical protein